MKKFKFDKFTSNKESSNRRRKRDLIENITILSAFNVKRQQALARLKELFPNCNLKLSKKGEIICKTQRLKFKIFIPQSLRNLVGFRKATKFEYFMNRVKNAGVGQKNMLIERIKYLKSIQKKKKKSRTTQPKISIFMKISKTNLPVYGPITFQQYLKQLRSKI